MDRWVKNAFFEIEFHASSDIKLGSVLYEHERGAKCKTGSDGAAAALLL